MDFGVRAAGTAADFPPVILQAHNAFIRNAHLTPQSIGFVILGMDGNPQLISGQLQFFSQKFPAPGNNFLFKVVTKGEIAQHFKISMVAGSVTYIFNITGTHALLAGGDTGRGRLHFASKERFKGCHASTNNQQGRVILRNQGCTGQHQMATILEKFQELFADLITSHVFHNFSLLHQTRQSSFYP